MRPAPYLALCLSGLLLAGCLTPPEIEALDDSAPVEGPFPELAPVSALPPPSPDPERGALEAQALEARAAGLRARAQALSARRP
ncbi:hypothetical protein PSA7680_02906 [Pseudoruegeria aquimaris]|uniref:Uncharacterized protein n=1 Tax=Pseudoruegeria aquimaris TaxID=393663 RepID=A0A1Y5T5B6_9RHOB|nr:hypothetical protein [Pseudoruegeria aquimaris]SLN55785.1 hypothetical protein PSA7680_02906 [Pseudoruegeria aquimaris]